MGVTTRGFEIHFEQKDGGFFIRTATSNNGASSSISSAETSSTVDGGASSSSADWESDRTGDPITLTTEHFTVLPSSQPVSIRVNYGPFSTKQTVPVRLLVPDPLDSTLPNGTSANNAEPEMIPPLDLSAHIVTPTVPKDTPILRVLFHAGQTAFGLPISPQSNAGGSRQQVCSFFSFPSLF